jgi:PAS domain S-box-containing protein
MNNKGSILLVDDTHETLLLLTKLLKDEGYNTLPADSGELALAALNKITPDLILLDVEMPGIDGFEVCRRIKSNKELMNIPVIFLTAATEKNELLIGLRLGAADYMAKPFEKQELLMRVRTHLDLFMLNKSLRAQAKELQQKNNEYASLNEKFIVSDAELKRNNLLLEEVNHKLFLAKEIAEKNELRFKTIFAEAPLGIAVINSLNGKILKVNSKFIEITGRTEKKLKTIDWMSISHPDDIQEELDNMALMNVGKISGFHMEKRYLHPDGTIIWINMKVAPVVFENKDFPCHLTMIENISRRKQA